MAISITCTAVQRVGGKAYIRFGKREREFSSLQQAKDFVRDVLTKDVLEAIAIAKWLDADPNATNPTLIEGRTVTADLTIANVVRVS